MSVASNKGNEFWYIDTGATVHLSTSSQSLCNLQSSSILLTSANGNKSQVTTMGDKSLQSKSTLCKLDLKGVLILPSGNKNLVPMIGLCDDFGWRLNMGSKDAFIYEPKSLKVIANCVRIGDMFALDTSVSHPQILSADSEVL